MIEICMMLSTIHYFIVRVYNIVAIPVSSTFSSIILGKQEQIISARALYSEFTVWGNLNVLV